MTAPHADQPPADASPPFGREADAPTGRRAPRGSDDPPLSLADTVDRIRGDFGRLAATMGNETGLVKRLFWFLLPTFQGLMLYRFARMAYTRNWRAAAYAIYSLSQWLTRVDIPPTTAIGRRCYLGHCPIVLSGRIGDDFTLHGDGGIGGGFATSDDVGGGPGLPMLGHRVTMAVKSTVLGPVRVGDGARIGPGAVVTRHVPPGALAAVATARISGAAPADAPGASAP